MKSHFNLGRLLKKQSSSESVYFFTFHKCASSLFSSYILKNIEGLEDMNYARLIYDGENFRKGLKFHKTGYAYGPIRLSANPKSAVHSKLIEPTTQSEFLMDKLALFLIRDPRDILISEYYSYGFTHGLSEVEHIKKLQLEVREDVKTRSLEDYVLSRAEVQIKHFKLLDEVSKSCKRAVVLRYEDMIENFDHFMTQLRSVIPVSEEVEKEIHNRSRPVTKEDQGSHRRSGQIRNFESKLDKDTLSLLNNKLATTLEHFGYVV